jgi:hypothetical protein
MLAAEGDFNACVGGKATYGWAVREPVQPRQEAERAEPLRLDRRGSPLRSGQRAVKRTALNRFKHECCTMALCPDGRAAFYSSDDKRRECICKFASRAQP